MTIAWQDVVQDDLDFNTIEYTIYDVIENYEINRLKAVLVKKDDREMEEHYETVHDMEGEMARQEAIHAIPKVSIRMRALASAPDYFHILENIFHYN